MINVNNDKHFIQCIFDSEPQNGSMRPRSDSGDNDTLSEETAVPQNVTKDPLCLLGEGGIGMNIKFFTDWHIKTLNHAIKVTQMPNLNLGKMKWK